jgi:uncharacterized protein (TIGR03435 family)
MPTFSLTRFILRSSLVVALALPGIPTFAQTTAAAADATDYVPTLTFDIVSIRESGPTDQHGLRVGIQNPPHSSHFTATNFTIRSLVQVAYGFGTPIANAPDWMTEKYYNVQAQSDAATDAKLAKLTDDQAKLEKQHMIQAMLADRLGLKTHLETRESSIYNLVVAKGGSKLQPYQADDADGQPTPGTTPVGDVQAHGNASGLEFDVKALSIKGIAGLLTSQVTTPVIDQTGLTGYYNFTLQIGREWSANNPDAYPSVFTALQEQLGLKLDPTKAPVPNLVIDHIQPPSAN